MDYDKIVKSYNLFTVISKNFKGDDYVFDSCQREYVIVYRRLPDTITDEKILTNIFSKYARYKANKLQFVIKLHKYYPNTYNVCMYDDAPNKKCRPRGSIIERNCCDVNSLKEIGIPFYTSLIPAFFKDINEITKYHHYGNNKHISFYTNGYPKEEYLIDETYNKIFKHGKYISYYPNGAKKEEGNYENNLKKGKWLSYDITGNKIEDGTYNYNKRDGRWIDYHNKHKKSEGIYYKGKPSGKWIIYDTRGNKYSEGFMRDGKYFGKWIFYHDNGKKECEGLYDNEIKNGPWIYYDKNGRKTNELNFANDVLSGHCVNYVNNIKESEGEYFNGRKIGKWDYYDGNFITHYIHT